MSVLDKYIYKNCFELKNTDHDINNYLFDASFSNQHITNENDCANYAYYNNHPSFFFKNKNGNDLSKCYVFKYDNIDPNNDNVNKESKINNITNLNYDLVNNKNLPRFNLLEKTTVDQQPLDNKEVCSTMKGLHYYLMKSFSNSYEIDYNDIKKRKTNINYYILYNYYIYLNNYDPTNINKFRNNLLKSRPYFIDLYHKNIDTTHMYYDTISKFINKTLLYCSLFGLGISINDTLIGYTTDTPTPITDLGPHKIGFNIGDSNEKLYFEQNVKMFPLFVGLPRNIAFKYNQFNATPDISNIFRTNFDYEDSIHRYVNRSFVVFLIYELRNKLLELSEFSATDTPPPYVTLTQNYNSYSNLDNLFAYNDTNNYSFTYKKIIQCLIAMLNNNGKKLYDYNLSGIGDGTEPAIDNVLSEFLLRLLVFPTPVNTGPLSVTDNINETCNKIKNNLYPDIIEKYLSSEEGVKNLLDFFTTIYNIPDKVKLINFINIFRTIYTGEYRITMIDMIFKDRIITLEYEYSLIKNDIANMKTYIDNIYLHSKLNNIENYIYNEKSKLKYLFNKNSSEKQKNDDLNFLNNFVFVENIIICIIIFILILFFIKK